MARGKMAVPGSRPPGQLRLWREGDAPFRLPAPREGELVRLLAELLIAVVRHEATLARPSSGRRAP
jgi:hypothetical protein